MITIEQYGDMIEKLADELPEEFFEGLNMGIIISEELIVHPESRNNELYIMGEYSYMGQMGRGIIMYYTPFAQKYGELPEQEAMEKLRGILRHEFRHHLEFLGGEDDLEEEDEERLDEYLKRED